jgi:hypothetical protein
MATFITTVMLISIPTEITYFGNGQSLEFFKQDVSVISITGR